MKKCSNMKMTSSQDTGALRSINQILHAVTYTIELVIPRQ